MPEPLALSVVIPTLDEAATLPHLLADLARQVGIGLEVRVGDGGSRDGTPELVRRLAPELPFPVEVIRAPRGRGAQMNRAARAARAGDLLFLHADTRLPHPGLLARARDLMDRERARRGSFRVAGHFPLRFRRSRPGADLAYYFYEAKTTLGRPDTVNGDQGVWISAAYLAELGGYDESAPYMEDARLARAVDRSGAWVTLPGALTTSARRFEAEGLARRQALNAILRGADHVGLPGFFEAAADAYREQDRAGTLSLGPFLELAHRCASRGGPGRLLSLWYAVGGYAASNAWQIAFLADCAHNRRRGLRPGQGPARWLGRFDRHLSRWVGTPAVRLATAGLTAGVFYALLAATRARGRFFG